MAAAVLRLNSPEAEPSSTYSHHHHLPHTPATPPHVSFSPEPFWTRLLGVGRRPVSASSRRRGLGPLPALQLLQAGAALRPAPAGAFTPVGGGRSWPGRRWPRCCLALPQLCVRVGEEGEGARREERERERIRRAPLISRTASRPPTATLDKWRRTPGSTPSLIESAFRFFFKPKIRFPFWKTYFLRRRVLFFLLRTCL